MTSKTKTVTVIGAGLAGLSAAFDLNRAGWKVTVLEARNRTFTISGSVGMPGEYQILQSDFRLLNALNTARNVTSTGIDYVYIIHKQQPGAAGGGTGAGTSGAASPTTPACSARFTARPWRAG